MQYVVKKKKTNLLKTLDNFKKLYKIYNSF